MASSTRSPWRRWGAAALLGLTALAQVVPTHAAPWDRRFRFANLTFETVWAGPDQVVKDGKVARSWTWGPTPWFDYKEFYRQSPNGLRQVQYFDKSRMEINDPSNTSVKGVTNGLLVVEMVSGHLKGGNDPYDFILRAPADVPVAGDPGNVNASAPTYSSFAGISTYDNNGYRDGDRTGQAVGTVLDNQGNRSNNAALARDAGTTIVAYNTVTGHNIPQVFRDFIQNGPVDGLFAFGYPISDPYWIRAKVGGVEKDVFVQLYERRVVTYTPTNSAAYRVEMGNVGQHYFQWRYPQLGQAWGPGEGRSLPIAYASKVNSPDHWETFTAKSDGSAATQLTSGSAETVPYSWRRVYQEGASPRLMTDSRRSGSGRNRQLFSINLDRPSEVRQHTLPSGENHVYNAAVSPDGTQIATVIQVTGGLNGIAIMPFSRDLFSPYPSTPYSDTCSYESPTWLPDGSGLVYSRHCGAEKRGVYRADLKYDGPATDDYVAATLVNERQLGAVKDADNYFPRVSPDGTQIVFSSNRDGNSEIYVMSADGSNVRRVTTSPADDGAASWSPDGTQLIFDSNRDGDYDLYKLSLADVNTVVQLTNNSVDDRWPLWFQ